MLASRLVSCAATKASVARPSRAFAILVSTSSGVSNPSTVESRAASALASALPRRAVVDGRLQGVSSQCTGVRLRSRDRGVSARELGGQRCGGDDAQESVGHLGVDLQRRDPRRYV